MKLRWRNETFRAQQLESGESYRGSAAATAANVAAMAAGTARRRTVAMYERPAHWVAQPAGRQLYV